MNQKKVLEHIYNVIKPRDTDQFIRYCYLNLHGDISDKEFDDYISHVRREVFEKIGYFDEAHFCYLEDVDIGYRARLFGYVNVCEPLAIVYHVGSASSGSRHNAFKVELTAANNLYFIYKNMNILQIIINLPLFVAGVIIKHVFYLRKGLGRAHIKGLSKGFSKIIKNYDKRVTFGARQFAYSILMQFELWINLIKRIV